MARTTTSRGGRRSARASETSKRAKVQRRTRKSRKRVMEPEDLLRIRFVSDPQISPDGSTILFTHKKVGEKNNYHAELWTTATDGETEARAFTSSGKDGHGRWSPDGSQVAFVRGSETGSQIFLIPSGGGEARKLTSFPEGTIASFQWSPDGSRLAVSFRETAPEWTSEAKKARAESGGTTPPWVIDDPWYRLDGDGYFGAQRFEIYTVDAESGAHEKLYSDVTGDYSFTWSPDGRELAVASNRHKKALMEPWHTSIYRVNASTGRVREIKGLPEGPKTALEWSPDGKTIAYAGREGHDDVYSPDNLELWICDVDSGRTRCLTKDTDYCLLAIALTDTSAATFGASIRWSPNSKDIYVLLGWHGESHVARIARRGGELEWVTSGKTLHSIGNFDDAGEHLAMSQGSPTRFDEIAVGEFDRWNRFGVRRLTDLNGPLLSEVHIAKPENHWVRTEDGNRVQVWALFPPHKAKRGRFPAVLEIHGGPHAMYSIGLFHEFQVLCGKGYAVFFSNPRGSKGYGEEHCAAIRGSWGGADWVDIEAVTEFMQSHKNVNEKRMGVMGGSYGGYMTNWVIGHTRAYRGAITDRCVSNLVSAAGNSDFPQVPDSYWPGNHWDKSEFLWERSPVKYLGKCKTPTLIIHSEGDLRCNVEQGEQVHSILSLRGVPTRFVRYPRETSHGMSRGGPPDMRIHRLGEILAWWERWLA